MNSPFSMIAAIVLGLAAVAGATLAVAIYRRTARGVENTVLLLMIAALVLNLACLSADNRMLAAGDQDPKHHYFLLGCANMLRILFFMAGAVLQFFTFAAVIDTRSGPRKAEAWIQYSYIGVVCFAALIGLGAYARALTKYLTASASSPPSLLQDDWFWPVAIMYGWIALWGVMQGLILHAIYKRRRKSSPEWKFPPFSLFWTGISYEEVESTGQWQDGWTVIDLSPNPQKARPPQWSWSYRSEYKAFAALWHISSLTIACCILGLQLSLSGGLFAQLWMLVFKLLPLGLLFPLLYYKTQFVFFDVLIKRGLLATAVIGSSSIFLSPLFSKSSGANVCLAIAGFTLLCAVMYRRLERAFDKYLFHRPDYARLLVKIGQETRRFPDSHSLLDHICATLQSALAIEFVRFSKEQYPPTPSAPPQRPVVSISIRSAEEVHGYLLLGSRIKGQPYQSEDLQFLRGVAAQVSASFDQFELQRRQHELQDQALQSELKALRAQINPSFLFNTLDTLSCLVHTNPGNAEKVTMNLARVFEFILEATQREQISLGQEADFVCWYLEIEQARLESRLRYKIDVPQELHSVPVPPLLIQPLVENAVKHGISQKPGGGCVTVEARRTNRHVSISVKDDGLGFDPERMGPQPATGLEGIRKRLEDFSDCGKLHIESWPDKGTLVSFELKIPEGEFTL